MRQPLQRQTQVRAAFIACERVDFIDDEGPRRLQHGAARLRAQKYVERLWRRDDDVRRATRHANALARWRVAGANPGAYLDLGFTRFLKFLANAGEGYGEVS